MQMQVKHRLPTIRPCVDHKPISALSNSSAPRDFAGSCDHLGQQTTISGRNLVN